MIESLRRILLRDIDALRHEIELFSTDEDLWLTLPGTSNPPGALALHICGNLQHFIGATLGGTGYRRNREAEFAARGLPRRHILGEIDRARTAVDETLAGLADNAAVDPYPAPFLDEATTVAAVLTHLSGHLMYHRGQINFARRFRTAP